MHCTSCGAAVDGASRFCQQCGAALGASSHIPAGGHPAGLALTVPRTITISPETLRLLAGWRGPALGAAAIFIAGLVLALLTNVILIAGVSGAGFQLPASIGVLAYGSLGVTSVGQIGGDIAGLGASASYSLSVAILGAFLLMLCALTLGGWISSRNGRPEDRGTVAAGVKTAVVFAVLMFVGSFFFSYFGMHPQHFEAFAFPLIFALIFASAGARIERDGFGFWRAPVSRIEARQPQIVSALGSGFDALVRTLKLAALALGLALVLLALIYPHQAGQILGGRQIIAEILLFPLWLPHLVGISFLAAQGIGFHVGAAGSLGTVDSLAGGSNGGSVSIFGASNGAAVPWYFLLMLAVPVASGIWGGFLAARRRSSTVKQRLTAALWASVPFLVLTWILAAMIGITVEGGVSLLSAGVAFGVVPANAIFWPLLWGPVLYFAGAGLQVWRSGDLAPLLADYKARFAAPTVSGTGAAAYAAPAPAGQTVVVPAAAAPAFCSSCGNPHSAGKPFCISCGAKLDD